LELAFSTKALRAVCESEERALREFGVELASILKRRLADLRAAANATDLVAGNPRPAPHSKEELMLDLADGLTVFLTANHAAIPRLRSGDIDWSNVSRVKLLRIKKHNG
jgi:hypothetical protein